MGPMVLLLTLAVLLLTVGGARATCRFGDTPYEVGDMWYPRVSDSGAAEPKCLVCKCVQNDEFNCTNNDCASACRGSSQEDIECCNICREADQSGRAPARSPRISPAPCFHNGRRYEQGERFTSDDTGLKPKAFQCVQCKCQDGAVHCEMEDCRVSCDNPITKPGHCCPTCPERPSFLNDRLHPAAAGQAGSTDLVAPIGNAGHPFTVERSSPRSGLDCYSEDRKFSNGATWHPMMGPFGRLACQMCRCSAGRIECSHVLCPKPGCAQPQLVAGQCCPLCLGSKGGHPGRALRPGVPTVKCIPGKRFLVLRSLGGANISSYIQYIFERPSRAYYKAEKHEWMFSNDTIQTFRVVKIDASDVMDLKRVASWKMMGITNQKRLSRFHRRELDVSQSCRSNCSARVLGLESALRLRRPKTRPLKCRRNERQLGV